MPPASPTGALPAESSALDRASVTGLLTEHAFDRAAGAPLVPGNAVRLLKDARENYPAWLDAIRAAEHHVHLEIYIVADDAVGRRFVDALAQKAHQGVQVRLIYDWLGSLGKVGSRFFRALHDAGIEVRAFNRPSFASPFDWLRRDHRKAIEIDGRVAFVSGLCITEDWEGNPAKGIAGWRDTGIEICGPAVAEVARAFAESWAETGPPLPPEDAAPPPAPPVGEVPLRVLAGTSFSTAAFRLDTLVAALARRRLWLADAYFAGTATYVQALRAAAQDGVDVRLLVPGAGTDINIVQAITRAGYRNLLEAGVRVFEWNGPMMHAKTAVADGHWSRIGSTNLNVASWIGNWEMDVVVEDDAFAERMEESYEKDLAGSTEIVLGKGRLLRNRRRVVPIGQQPRLASRRHTGRGRRVAAGAMRIGYDIGAVVGARRRLGPAESSLAAKGGLVLIALAAVSALWPQVTAIPVAFLSAWIGLSLLARAWQLRRRH